MSSTKLCLNNVVSKQSLHNGRPSVDWRLSSNYTNSFNGLISEIEFLQPDVEVKMTAPDAVSYANS